MGLKGGAIIILDVDAMPKEEGINDGDPNPAITYSHGKEHSICITKAANKNVPSEGVVVVCVAMTVATKLIHLIIDQVFNGDDRYITYRSNT